MVYILLTDGPLCWYITINGIDRHLVGITPQELSLLERAAAETK